MEALGATSSIIAVLQLSAKVVEYLNDVKDASKERAQCAVEASNLYSLLVNLRFRLEAGDASQPWYTAVRAFAVENGPLDQFKQALESLQSNMTDGGRLKKAGNALVWKFKKEEIASILNRMERLKNLVNIALEMDHFKLSQAIQDDVRAVRTQIPIIQSGVDTVLQNQDATRHRMLLEWISPTDYPAQQSDIISRRQEGTGHWFLNSPKVVQWLNEASATLFCPGIPGAGKTMIAAIMIDHLLKSTHNSSHGVAYVYCNYKAEEQNDSSMLAAILKQLVQGRLSTVDHIERLHQKHASQGTKPSLDDVYSSLRDVLAHYPTVHIVVDALDECRGHDGTRHRFLTKLRDLQAQRNVRIMATSRFIPNVVDDFSEALTLEVQASKEDVKRFVAGQIYRLPRCIQHDSALQDMVQEKIVEAVDGMFLLARLHTDSLLDKRTATKVKSSLAKLLKGAAALEKAYEGALQRIEGQLDDDRELAKKVLSWITFAKRPLTTAEICCALAVEPDDEELDPGNVLEVEELVSVCAGLVVVDPESEIIRLVHYTTQEYFERIQDAWNPAAQLDIATVCLTYLSFGVFKSGACSTDEEFEERLRQNEFLDYAAKHWGEHARVAEAEMADRACLFLLHSGLLSNATQVLEVGGYMFEGYSQKYPIITALHCTARFGLSNVTEKILSTLEAPVALAVHAEDSRGDAPLTWAAVHGHGEMVRLLLDAGADVNAQGGDYGNALIAASAGGHEPIVKLLLDAGADINAQGGHHGNALIEASAEGHEPIVKLLLDAGADINAQGGYHNNALIAASARGHEPIVKLLLDAGADINAQGGYHGNALIAASAEGHEPIVKLLLDAGADINAQGGYHNNALIAASAEGHEPIVKLLLDAGADINAQGGYHNNALIAALAGGHEPIVKLLLDVGADINAQGGHHGNALIEASAEGHEPIVKLLLDVGADINAQDGHHGNALIAASARGHEPIVKLLLDAGADVNAQGGYYSNALIAASAKGHEPVVKLLMSKDATLEAEDSYGATAVSQAAFNGRLSILQLFWSLSGGNPDSPDRYGRTLLWWAAAGGQTATVEALISQYGFNPRTADKFGRTPVWIAMKKGHDAVSKILSEECGEADIERIASPKSGNDDPSSMGCDVCTSSIKSTAFSYHCGLCAKGDWDMCEDCEMRSASCLEATHILAKRTWKDEDWVEVES